MTKKEFFFLTFIPTVLLVSHDTQSSISEAKPETQATSQTSLGTGMRAFQLLAELECVRSVFETGLWAIEW
jgi:hypothetical protein